MKETARESGMGNKQVRLTANLICRGAELGSCGTIPNSPGDEGVAVWIWSRNPGDLEIVEAEDLEMESRGCGRCWKSVAFGRSVRSATRSDREVRSISRDVSDVRDW